MVELTASWFATVNARPGSYEAREQAAEWMTNPANSDDESVKFGFATVQGWCDLDARGEDLKATQQLLKDLAATVL